MSGKSVVLFSICCLAALLSIIIYFLSASNSEKAVPVMNTLSSEQLLGLGYTDTLSENNGDIWDDADFSYSAAEKITSSVSAVSFPIDINAATADELTQIKGIGSATAEKIVSYRTRHGSFHSADELLNVDGIGSKKLSEIQSYIYIDPEIVPETSETTASAASIVNSQTALSGSETVTDQTTSSGEPDPFTDIPENEKTGLIELNTASLEELMTIDGVGEVIAGKIIEYAQSVGFTNVNDLKNVPGIGEKRFEHIAPHVYVRN